MVAAGPELSTLARQRGLEWVTSSFWSGYLNNSNAKIIRATLDEATMSSFYDVLAASDAGHFIHGGTLLEPNGDTRMCALFFEEDGGVRFFKLGAGELIILEYGPDAGSRPRATGATAQACRELRHLDAGLLAYTLDDWMNDDHHNVEDVNPRMRPRFIRLDANAQLVDGGVSVLDAGFCVTDVSNALAGWCDSLGGTEVLRYDSWFGQPPRAVFRHDGGVTVIADLDGQLLVGINEHHEGDGYARFDIGWLRNGRFELIRARQVVPLGYGLWTEKTAALTFIRPDLEAWEVVEAPLNCR